jgi:FKBP-type peptidyl-prolyl cis-trans isomerase FkpA
MSNKQFTTGVAVVVGVVVVFLFFVFGNPFAIVEQGLPASAALGGAGGQLMVQDEVVGVGEPATIGNVVAVHYTGMLQDGTVFDTSVGGAPYQFILGGGQVIPGWDQGIQGMQVGGKRLLVIPPDLAYGPEGYGPIPPNTVIVFEVELIDIVQ